MSNDKEIRDLFAKYSVPLDRDDVWEVQKARVVKHKALERLSAAMRIKWAAPQILRCEADEAVLLATGSTEHASEWSIGEARVVPMNDTGRKNQWGKPIYEPADGAIGNYQITPKQGAYPYAMAEKRAKDRVILKLAGLHGVYSEDEADEFKEAPRQSAPAPAAAKADPIDPAESESIKDFLVQSMDYCKSSFDMDQWASENRDTIKAKLNSGDRALLLTAWTTRKHSFQEAEKDQAA